MMCDGCNITLPGAHYRCLECEAFDYCYACYFGGVQTDGHLDEHPMVNFRYNCDSCHGFIVGTRIHCNVCDDFDLCYGCNHAQKFPDGHTAAHSTEIFTMTTVTSGNQQGGMLESYSHHHSWVLFCSLALSVADMVRNTPSQDVNVEYVQNANKLFQQCIELATNCLPTVAQTAISLKEQEDKKTDETEGKEDKEKSTEITDKKPTEALQQSEAESKDLLREKAFTVSSQERVLGLLAAMLLENTPVIRFYSTSTWKDFRGGFFFRREGANIGREPVSDNITLHVFLVGNLFLISTIFLFEVICCCKPVTAGNFSTCTDLPSIVLFLIKNLGERKVKYGCQKKFNMVVLGTGICSFPLINLAWRTSLFAKP